MTTPRRLGILGGMGPLATVDLMEKIVRLTPAATDQEHVPLVVWSDPRVPPRSDAILEGGPSPLPAMLDGVRALERAGAEGIAIACNTAHHWFDALRDATACELLHVADAVADDLQRRAPRPRQVGLLATAGTISAGLYQERLGARGVGILVPPPASQRDRVQAGIDAIKGGRLGDARPLLAEAASELLAAGAEVVVLACTEIPIGLRDAPEELRRACLDATEALARRCVEWALAPLPAAAGEPAPAPGLSRP